MNVSLIICSIYKPGLKYGSKTACQHLSVKQVCEGDEVIVSVQNMLEDGLATTIHWHGQHMLGTPYMDGVGQVTQCHIQHQETFVSVSYFILSGCCVLLIHVLRNTYLFPGVVGYEARVSS